MQEGRRSNIFGSINGMHYLEQNKSPQSRFIRIQGQNPLTESCKNITSMVLEENFNTQIEISSFTAWGLLFLGVILNSFVPCWLMGDVKAESLTRNSWRFLTVSILLIPFLMYEQRNAKEEKDKFYNNLTLENLRPIFVSTINFCLWLICLIYACKFTSMNHAVCLTGLRFFMISALKIWHKEKFHEFEIAGNIICIIGIILVLTDSITLPQVFDSKAERYLQTEPWKRLLIGDMLALFGSVVSVVLDQNHKVPAMPRFTYLFMYNIFLCFNLITAGYFFGGSEFTNNIKFGVFGLYTYANFVSVFYVSVMLGLYLLLANILISQIFNDTMINVASTFELICTAVIYHVLALELVPSGLTCLGYSFLVPGLIFIIGGQGALQDADNNKINFELYRPTEIQSRETRMTRRLQTKRSLATELNSSESPNFPTSFIDKKPFEMILEEDEN